MLYGLMIILILIIVVLISQLYRKKIIDKTEYLQVQSEVNQLKQQRENLEKDIHSKTVAIAEYNQKILEAQNQYQASLEKRTQELDNYIEKQKQIKENTLDTFAAERRKKIEAQEQQLLQEMNYRITASETETKNILAAAQITQENIKYETQLQKEKFEAILKPLQLYEKEQQERLFYTIQIPEEYQSDIFYLITSVSQQIKHPDIINKLVWSEYVKPNLDQTFKRVGIKDEPGIYKITNLENNKCYIGKSTNVKKRLADHVKGSLHISSIADQEVHHEMWKTGLWNWAFEVIIYCEKSELSEMEKYYIDFFQSYIYGYNKTKGGEG